MRIIERGVISDLNAIGPGTSRDLAQDLQQPRPVIEQACQSLQARGKVCSIGRQREQSHYTPIYAHPAHAAYWRKPLVVG